MSDLPRQLETFLRALRADLVEQRLLPIVALLVVAAIGVPVAFSVTASKAPAVQAAAPVVPAGPGAALAAAPPAHPAATHQLGPLHDPFLVHGRPAQPPASPSSSPITAKTGPTGPSGVGSSPAKPSTGTTGAGGSTGTSPGSSLKPPLNPVAARELKTYSVDYSFGQGTNLTVLNNALRLDAVPSNTAPVAQFLGVTKDTRKAAFLIWGPATASGDGICVNGQAPCQVIELKPGQTEFIDVLVPTAGIVQFELDMLAINTGHAATSAEALKAHGRQSTDGVKVLSKSNASALAKFEYSTVYGTLLPRTAQTGSTPPASDTRASATSEQRPSGALGSHRVRHAHGRR